MRLPELDALFALCVVLRKAGGMQKILHRYIASTPTIPRQVKIGQVEDGRPVPDRMRDGTTWIENPIIHLVEPGGDADLHKRFASARVRPRHEWFWATSDLVEYVNSHPLVGRKIKPVRSFRQRPQKRSKGLGVGRPSKRFPMVLVVVADASVRHARRATTEDFLEDRSLVVVSDEEMDRLMSWSAPGWESADPNPAADTSLPNRMAGRFYKQYYSGKSDRGENHDGKTRGNLSREFWKYRVPKGDPLYELHERIVRGGRALDWRDYLKQGKQRSLFDEVV